MPKFLHTSDWHLGVKLSQFPPEKSRLRRESAIIAISSIISNSLAEGIDFALISGDIFDNPSPSVQLKKTFKRIIKPLLDTKKNIFIVPGTHDYYIKDGLWDDPEFSELNVFRQDGFSSFKLEDFNLNIWGVPVLKSNQDKNWLKSPPQIDSSTINILVYHGDFRGDGREFDEWYYPFEISDLSSSGFDYIALGHHHKKQEITSNDKILAAYSGSPFGWSFRRSETGERYFAIGDIERKSVNLQFRHVPGSQIQILQANIDNPSEIENALTQLECLNSTDFVRLTIKGKADPDEFIHRINAVSSRFAYFQIDNQISAFTELLPPDNHYLKALLELLDDRLKSGEINDEFHSRLRNRAISLFSD